MMSESDWHFSQTIDSWTEPRPSNLLNISWNFCFMREKEVDYIRNGIETNQLCIIIITIIIITTRPMPAYGRQGLAGVSLRASGAQLGRIESDDFSWHTGRHCIIIYISPSPSSPSSSPSSCSPRSSARIQPGDLLGNAGRRGGPREKGFLPRSISSLSDVGNW